MLAVSQSIVHHGTLAVAPYFGVVGRGGHHFAKYGIGLSLLAVPFVAVGDLVSVVAGNQAKLEAFFAASLVPLTMGFLAASLFRTARRLGAGSRWASVIAVGSVFGTYALPYGKDFFAEPLTTLAIVLSIECLISGRWELAGVALAAAVTTRPESVVLVAILPIIVWIFRGFRQAFVYGSIAAIGAVVDAVYNQYRFGSVLKTGYGSEGFTTPFAHGAARISRVPTEEHPSLRADHHPRCRGLNPGLDCGQPLCRGSDPHEFLGLLRALGYLALLARRMELGSAAASARDDPSHGPAFTTDQEGTSRGPWPPGRRIRGVRVDHPGVHQGPAVGSPSALSGAERPASVPTRASVTRYTLDRIQNTTSGDSRRYLSLWQVDLREFGTKGLLAGISGSLILLVALVVAIRRSPIWRNHSPPGPVTSSGPAVSR